ncbi:MAG: hypothetical protein J5797_11085 [Prevotella sp.]|nr:hypothetical protein [Prevotella sp.]
MKKKYIEPVTAVYEVKTAGMIAVSGFEESLGNTGGSGSGALSRESFFDDDEL